MNSDQNYYPSPEPKGFNASPAGNHSEGHRVNNRRFSDVFEGMFHWVKKRLPSPGTGNYAFSTLSLYELSPIGPAVAARVLFQTVQPPQLYLNGQLVGTVGLGGLVAGQMISQPLLDPATGTYGGARV